MMIVDFLVSRQPMLKKKLRIVKISTTPQDYVKKALKSSIFFGVIFFIFTFFLTNKNGSSIFIPIVVGFIAILFFYSLNIRKIDVMIRKKAREIDRGVLFAGRFLLVKLNSGDPLINAIEESSKSYGAASEYFSEIIRELELGTPIEKALEKATEYCPSHNLKKILFQITNALKIGIDVSNYLDATLDEIADQQLVEIMKYGKKLSSLTMFYMLVAIIAPSLGMTLFVVIASLISINLDLLAFSFIVLALIFIQFIFITLFKSARPIMEV